MQALQDARRSVENASFSRSPFGYKTSDVDTFLDDLQKKIDESLTERDEHLHLIEDLQSKISQFQKEKDSITQAILNSEKIAQASVIDAGVKSKYILQDASDKATKMLSSATAEYEKRINEARKINKSIELFINDCIRKFDNQIETMRSFNKIPISSLDSKDFQVDDMAKRFLATEECSKSEIFSDSAHINVMQTQDINN